MFTRNGRMIQISQRRHCPKCTVYTDQVCFSIKYGRRNDDSNHIMKTCYWTCSTCGNQMEEMKEVPPISDRTKIIQRILRMHEDYPIRSMNITSEAEKLTIEIGI